MDKEVKSLVEKLLINDESMTDQELKDHFVNELNVPKDLAKKCIAQRGKAMGDPDFKLKLN